MTAPDCKHQVLTHSEKQQAVSTAFGHEDKQNIPSHQIIHGLPLHSGIVTVT